MKKCICYSLWGDKPEYTHGIQKNFELNQKLLPDWQMVVYYDSSVPKEYVKNNKQIEWIEITDGSYGEFCRFHHMKKCDTFLSRDLDSRTSEREVYCIHKWLESDLKFLSIRDKIPQHYEWPFMAGMWGVKDGFDEYDFEEMKKYEVHHQYTADQQFLRNHIYSKYKEQILFLGPKEDEHLKETWNEHFIGQGYYEDDSFRYSVKTGLVIPRKSKEKMILIQSYYNPKDKKRQEELELCLKQNCFNTSVEKVLLFLDNENVKYPKHEKIEVYSSVDQLTYQDAFFYAEKFYKDRICCLVNNDVFLDHGTFSDLSEIDNLTSNNIVLSLTRHEFNVHTKIGKMDDAFRQALFAHTQDAWIWKANFQPKDTNFRLGTLGCDNAINDRLKQAGKIPMNLGSKYKVYHVDAVRGKTSTNKFSKEKHAEFHDFNRESYPEERGQFLTPDYGMVYNLGLDEFAKQLNFSDIDKYTIICEMLSRKMKIKNR